jgi:ABC-type anion transport system duplicated permease subunit
MCHIKIYIPYAPLSMNMLDIYLYFNSQTGNTVISVYESIKTTPSGNHKTFTIYANPYSYHSIFKYIDSNYRILRYIPYNNKYAKIRAWIYEN